jgi:hypothetical protein
VGGSRRGRLFGCRDAGRDRRLTGSLIC